MMADEAAHAGQIDRVLAEAINQAVGEMNKGNFAAAEPVLRKGVAEAPQNALVVHNLALLLYHTQRQAEAETLLVAAVQRGALPASLMLLAQIFENTGRIADAAKCYDSIIKHNPRDYAALMKLGALNQGGGDSKAAGECFRRALEAKPRDIEATEKYTGIIFDGAPETAVRLNEEALAGAGEDLNARARALRNLILQKEWWERMRHGKMGFHATGVDELFFDYAGAELKEYRAVNAARVAANADDLYARIDLGTTEFCLGDRFAAEELFRSVPNVKGHVLENVRFAPSFYDELRSFTGDDLLRMLPPLENLTPLPRDARGVVYLSCNFIYFRAFAMPMLVSLHERSPDTPVHIHIMDPSADEARFAVAFAERLMPGKFAVSIERPNLQKAAQMEARCYYHAIRFIRLLQHLETYDSPLWLMDVDAIVNRDLSEMLRLLDDTDVSMRIRPGRFEPWNQFNACVVGWNVTDASREYLRLIAAYVAYFHQRKSLRWGIDQLAMYGVFMDMHDRAAHPRLALLGEREVDYRYRDDGFIWCNSGAAKFRHLQRIQKSMDVALVDPEREKFVAAFERYWRETQRIAAQTGIAV